ncbi:allantoinase AllB [Pseudolysinimonas sp.]|uniref:allantoinase AllB n=1 Tax=Pseudolysinimonas sp. TaxID=2680009 RepID=UPI003F7FE991
MSLDLVVRGRALVDGAFREAAVGVRDGRVATLDAGPEPAAETVVLAPDEVLLPGLVDTHVHINEPGRTDWEGFASATAAAAAGGVTAVLDMPLNSIPPTTTVENLRVKQEAARGAVRIDVGFWGGAVPENLGSLRGLWEAGVFGFKCFLAPSGVPEFGHLDARQLDAALEEIAGFGGLLIVHAEDPRVLHDHANAGGPDYGRYVASRPDEAEVAAISNVIAGVRRTGARAHILHLSSAAALPELRAARAEGLPITVETCPHYLSLAAEGVPNGATQYKCAPPIRSEENRDALWRGLLDGDIDLVVTDHSPSTAELKFAGDGDFGVAWGGIAGLQLGLSAVWTAARGRGVPLERVVEWMSSAPARFAGLTPAKGAIAPGADADLAVFAPDARRVIRAGELLHRNPVSAYDGRELRGEVRRTWLRGAAPDLGHLLERTR